MAIELFPTIDAIGIGALDALGRWLGLGFGLIFDACLVAWFRLESDVGGILRRMVAGWCSLAGFYLVAGAGGLFGEIVHSDHSARRILSKPHA